MFKIIKATNILYLQCLFFPQVASVAQNFQVGVVGEEGEGAQMLHPS